MHFIQQLDYNSPAELCIHLLEKEGVLPPLKKFKISFENSSLQNNITIFRQAGCFVLL